MVSILVVDDEPNNFDVIETFLDDPAYELHYAADGTTALDNLDIYNPDLILLDVMMPGLDGLEVCSRIKKMSRWEGVPIIMVTALSTKQDLAGCLAVGADDFIGKPVNSVELRARVKSMLRIRQQYNQLASFNSKLESQVQKRTAQLQALIYRDHLTSLPSRVSLVDRMRELLRQPQAHLAIITLDCDQFKLVNGSFGYGIGDQLLIALAERLQALTPVTDLLVRMGEDEFCFLCQDIHQFSDLQPFLSAIQASFSQPLLVPGVEIFLTASMGIVLATGDSQAPEELLKSADIALYQAKAKGRGSYQLFDPAMEQEFLARLTLETELHRAMERQEFLALYQPIVNLATLEVAGFEALIRWQHPTRGLVSPLQFIPCLETTGFIVPVGLDILRQACVQLNQWHQQGWPDLTMSVNLSIRQFRSATLLEDIDRILAETRINPARLKLEITESCIMDNAESVISVLEQIRARQIQMSIDDFGTGYSSLSYLCQLPVTTLKIDRCFIDGIDQGERNLQLVKIMMLLSQELGLDVIAEGVETMTQVERLRGLGCQYGQGFCFSRPLEPAMIEQQYLTPAASSSS